MTNNLPPVPSAAPAATPEAAPKYRQCPGCENYYSGTPATCFNCWIPLPSPDAAPLPCSSCAEKDREIARLRDDTGILEIENATLRDKLSSLRAAHERMTAAAVWVLNTAAFPEQCRDGEPQEALAELEAAAAPAPCGKCYGSGQRMEYGGPAMAQYVTCDCVPSAQEGESK